MISIRQQAAKAQKEAPDLALLSATQKNKTLKAIRNGLLKRSGTILKENARDLKPMGESPMRDRVRLDEKRLRAIAESLDQVIALPDPVGETIDRCVRPNGLKIERVRVPIGVIGMIYEARPNVTIDAAALGLKAGNAVILKGGSAALHTNRALIRVIHEALRQNKISPEAVQFIGSDDRGAVVKLLRCEKEVDAIIPRGGRALIDFVRKHSRIPVIETGASVVHLYVDAEADLKKAVKLAVNSKTRRVSICNALDVLLVHQDIAPRLLPALGDALQKKSPVTEIRSEKKLNQFFKNYPKLRSLKSSDFDTEFLDHVLAVKTVRSAEEAMAHIARHSLRHTEGIVTENKSTAERFLRAVDAACVYHNASTQFSDGGEFGLGAEIGISTQKLHVRGPFALEGLTTYKWIIRGTGQIRP